MNSHYRASDPTGLRFSVPLLRPGNNLNVEDTGITERVAEPEEATMAPELEEPDTTPEPEEPSMVDIDDEHYANMTNVKVSVHYDFPSNEALHYHRLLKLHPVAKPTSMVAALEQVMFTEIIHHQLADILHSAISLKMLDKQMAEIECPGSKKQANFYDW
ncbi:hypothetical protein J3F81_000612 [Coemansia sp. RSA 371]|nr:hypothetical protein J3F81_000612 [Coemansia sp. RSA 371]